MTVGPRWTAVVAAALALAGGSAPEAVPRAAASCAGPYAYAGIAGWSPAQGVAADLSARARPALVGDGQVAAWVGFGGRGLGPNGTDAWIQAGLVAFGSGRIRVYHEIAFPGRAPVYTEVVAEVPVGKRHRIAVRSPRSERWTVVVDGRRVAGPVHLPGSSAWRPVATAESWVRGGAGCNRLAYGFDRVAVSNGRRWTRLESRALLQDRGLRVEGLTRSSFVVVAAR